ncbi:uncharacterized protein LOC132196706 [Neocloeon triangulifer]|uniref:uncharacterized protein LOC132196706 n=1 Tax=Neocloeon triangulifer TaxID=2078957 RepID=UPI00286F0752|nr:uncharacterized protein LOC132196706 [Neocloeon triangulifer]
MDYQVDCEVMDDSSIVVLSSSSDDEDNEPPAILTSYKAGSSTPGVININPQEAVVRLVNKWKEKVKVNLQFFLSSSNDTALPVVKDKVIHLATTTMKNAIIHVDRTHFELKPGVVMDVAVTFEMRPSCKQEIIGVLMKATPMENGTIKSLRDKKIVTFNILTMEVNPDCDVRLEPCTLSVPKAHTDTDFVVLFFVIKIDAQKLAVACNKEVPFQELVDEYKSNFPATNKTYKLKFTNMRTRQSCHANQTPSSIGLGHQDHVFVNLCKCTF